MNQLPTDLSPSRLVKIQTLLLIAVCSLSGCDESPEDGPAKTVGDVTKAAEVIDTTSESEAAVPSEQSTKEPSTDLGKDAPATTVAKEEAPVAEPAAAVEEATAVDEPAVGEGAKTEGVAKEESPVAEPTNPHEESLANAENLSPTDESSNGRHPPKHLLEAAVELESLVIDVVGQKPTIYTPDKELFSGWAKTHFESNRRQVQMLAEYTNGVLHGKSWLWHENGELQAIEHNKQNTPHGSIIRWHANGQKAYEGTSRDGQLDGLATRWHENGQKMWEITFKDGKRDGTLTQWHGNGQKKWEITFRNGQQDGRFAAWYHNGQMQMDVTYTNGRRDDGPFTCWHANAQKASEGTFKDGKLADLVTRWDETGNVTSEPTEPHEESIEERLAKAVHWLHLEFRNDRLLWRDTGERFTGWYKKTFEETDEVKTLEWIKNGKADGPFTIWHANGRKQMEGTARNGELVGTGTEWDENGKLISE